jgi:uncharacterized protein YbbK (DUF523 family)
MIKPQLLVSACLLGEKVRYDGKDCVQRHPGLQKYIDKGVVIALCPEKEGGLNTPRPPAEIEPGGSAELVLAFQARVLTEKGDDVTKAYQAGAEKALDLVKKYTIRVAILKSRSPSCGSKQVYDGSHSKRLIQGMGVTARLLEQQGVKIFDETEIDAALDYLRFS